MGHPNGQNYQVAGRAGPSGSPSMSGRRTPRSPSVVLPFSPSVCKSMAVNPLRESLLQPATPHRPGKSAVLPSWRKTSQHSCACVASRPSVARPRKPEQRLASNKVSACLRHDDEPGIASLRQNARQQQRRPSSSSSPCSCRAGHVYFMSHLSMPPVTVHACLRWREAQSRLA